MATSLLKFSIHSNLAQVVQQEIVSRSSKYYFALGRNYSWGTTNDVPLDALDTFSYEVQTRKDFIKFTEIGPNDVSVVIDRNEWQRGFIYDDYDEYTVDKPAYSGATSLDTSRFYVVTDEFNVYKCLYNGGNAASLEKPTGTSVLPIGPLSDGYVWKFMYNIPLYLRNKFLTATQIPVTTALSSQYYANGRLSNISIVAKGSGYTPNQELMGQVYSDLTGEVPNLHKLYGTGTLFTTELSAMDLIQIGDERYAVESIQSDTELTISEYAYIPTAIPFEKVNTYITVVGDGRRSENPYRIIDLEITNGGNDYGADIDVVFSPPTLLNGRIAKGRAFAIDGVITSIVLDDPGFGYSAPPTVTIVGNDGGSGATAIAITQTTSAYLEPIVDNTSGEIINVIVRRGGEGYTNAVLTVVSADESGDGAELTVNTDFGQLDTKQADQELLAKNGAIHIIKMSNTGNGYSVASVTVDGDGSGCTAVPEIVNGRIERIVVTDIGEGYTSATVNITGDGTNASAYAVISPFGGHGKNAINELFGRTVLFYGKVDNDPIKTVRVTSGYRQVTLIKKPKQYSENLLFNNFSGTAAYRISGSGSVGSPITVGSIVYVTSGTAKYKYRVVAKQTSSLLLTAIDNVIDPTVGESVKTLDESYSYGISLVELPDVDRFSGDIIYTDNRQSFIATDDQIVTISSRFKL